MRFFFKCLAILTSCLPVPLLANGFAGLYDFPEAEEVRPAQEPEADIAEHSVLEDGVPALDVNYGEGMPSLSTLSDESEDISQEAIEARDRALAALDDLDEPTCGSGGSPARLKDLKPLESSLRRSENSGLLKRKLQRRVIELTPDC